MVRSTGFVLEPQEVPQRFKWRGKYFHNTYPGFIEVNDLLHLAQTVTTVPLRCWSIAWERKVTQVGNTTRTYCHTHMGLIFEAAINIEGCHKFDVGITDDNGLPDYIHPCIVPKLHIGQMGELFLNYHVGRKYDPIAGRVKYEKPVLHEFYLPPDFEFGREIITDIEQATSHKEACVTAGVKVRSVTDVVKLREAAQAAPVQFKHKYKPEDFLYDMVPNWEVVHIWGPTGIGKTKWAAAQCKNPCLIKPFTSVGALEAIKKKYVPGFHDALILDEADLRFMTREQVIAFLDMDEEFQCDVRFTSFSLAPVRKIFISNPDASTLYPRDESGAIARRLRIEHLTQPLFGMPQQPAGTPTIAGQPYPTTPATQ